MLPFLLEISHVPIKSEKKHKLSVTSVPNDRHFMALNFSAAAAPVLPVQIPVAGVRAGYVRAPVPRRDYSLSAVR